MCRLFLPFQLLEYQNRTHRAPTSLKDYVCHTSFLLTDSLSYDKLSSTCNNYVLNVSSVYEPQYYQQAACILKWSKDVSKEIVALEANHT